MVFNDVHMYTKREKNMFSVTMDSYFKKEAYKPACIYTMGNRLGFKKGSSSILHADGFI